MTNRFGPQHFVLAITAAALLGACSSAAAPAATPGAPAAAPNATIAAPAATTNGATSAGAGAAGATDACALITDAEVVAAFGETMLAAVPSVLHGDATCNWMHAAGSNDLTVSISSRPSSAAAITSMQAAYGTDSAVSGVGDAALQFGGILQFVKGTTLVTIATGDGPAIISGANFKALAVSAAGRV